MKTPEIDYTMLDKSINIFESNLDELMSKPGTPKFDELYSGLMLKTLKDIRYAKDEGKSLVATTVMMPAEILHAMDIVPMNLEVVTGFITKVMDSYEETLGTAKAYGFAPEICSVHRLMNGHIIAGHLPKPDAVTWSNQVCDNTGKAGDPLIEIYGVPGFFMDRPFRYTEKSVQYLKGELEKMVAFLEEITGRKMDWERLKDEVRASQRFTDLAREINELRKHGSAPMNGKRAMQILQLDAGFCPSFPEVLEMMEVLKDEVKANVEEGKGVVENEQYRLLTLFVPPIYMPEIYDWLEEEHGAVTVMDPYCCTWGDGDMDPEKPLESLARKSFYRPTCRQMHGPVSEGVLIDTISTAKEYQAEGVLFWAHVSCREGCACIKMLKDELAEKVDIPMLVIDTDIGDPGYISMDQTKDKLEGFLEILDDRK